jgi:hypothetical protein
MEYATTKSERTVAELVGRLFGVGERTAVARRAAAALLAANPELERIEELPRGTIVEVPEVEDAAPTEELRPLPDVAAAAVVRRALGELDDLSELVEAIIDDRVARAEGERNIVRSAPVKTLAREDELISDRLETAVADAEAELAEARALRREQRRALEELAEDVAGLAELLEQ